MNVFSCHIKYIFCCTFLIQEHRKVTPAAGAFILKLTIISIVLTALRSRFLSWCTLTGVVICKLWEVDRQGAGDVAWFVYMENSRGESTNSCPV